MHKTLKMLLFDNIPGPLENFSEQSSIIAQFYLSTFCALQAAISTD